MITGLEWVPGNTEGCPKREHSEEPLGVAEEVGGESPGGRTDKSPRPLAADGC